MLSKLSFTLFALLLGFNTSHGNPFDDVSSQMFFNFYKSGLREEQHMITHDWTLGGMLSEHGMSALPQSLEPSIKDQSLHTATVRSPHKPQCTSCHTDHTSGLSGSTSKELWSDICRTHCSHSTLPSVEQAPGDGRLYLS